MIDFIIVIVLLLLISGACAYIYREKKKGRKCIGCPYSGQCQGKSTGGCGSNNNTKLN